MDRLDKHQNASVAILPIENRNNNFFSFIEASCKSYFFEQKTKNSTFKGEFVCSLEKQDFAFLRKTHKTDCCKPIKSFQDTFVQQK